MSFALVVIKSKAGFFRFLFFSFYLFIFVVIIYQSNWWLYGVVPFDNVFMCKENEENKRQRIQTKVRVALKATQTIIARNGHVLSTKFNQLANSWISLQLYWWLWWWLHVEFRECTYTCSTCPIFYIISTCLLFQNVHSLLSVFIYSFKHLLIYLFSVTK